MIFKTCTSSPTRLSHRIAFVLAILGLAVLTACGGGGGTVPEPDPNANVGSAITSGTPTTEATPIGSTADPTPSGTVTTPGAATPTIPVAAPPTTPSTPPATTPTAPPSTPPTASLDPAKTCNIATLQQDFLKRVNAERANGAVCGGVAFPPSTNRLPVGWNSKLFEAAAAHSKDMVTRNFFDHTNPDGKSPGDRIAAQGYTWGFYGENIAAGQRDVTAVMDAWMGSDGHCRNIMNTNAGEVALACVLKSNNTPYWTMVLARPR